MSTLNPTPQSHPTAGTSARTAYVAVVELLDRYYDALYHGDVAGLNQVFHPTAIYATVSDGELLQLDLAAYLPMVAARVSPAQRGDPYGFQLEAIEFAGPTTALARLRSSLLGKCFVDFLTLFKVHDEWRITAKVFHYDVCDPPGAPTGEN